MATTITVQSLLRNADQETILVASASGAFNPGDITTVGDGRVGIVTGLSAIATGDPMTLRVYGQFDFLKNATSDTYAVGAPVFFDPVAKTCKTTSASGYYYLGRCVKASVNGDTYVYTDLNDGPPGRVPTAAVAAAGSVQGDAAGLIEGFNVVSAADGTKGVILPTAVAGMVVYVKGTAAAVLKVYPATGGAINAVAANGALSLTTGAMPSIFIASSATQWYTIPLVAS